MAQSIEVLASAIHDAKNQLFFADNLIADVAAKHDIDLGTLREAIDRASSRLTRALLAYRLESGLLPLSISAASVHALIEDAVAIARAQYAHLGLHLESRCDVDGPWPFDRDLVLDVIGNALENAARFARAKVVLEARVDDGMLSIRISDDGGGLGTDAPATTPAHGLGLHIGRRIARLHQRRGQSGELSLHNAELGGGAVFELRLP